MVRRAGAIAAVTGLLAAIVVMAALTSGQVTQLPVPRGTMVRPSPPAPPTLPPGLSGLGGQGGGSDVFRVIITVVVGILLLAVAALVGYLLYRLIRVLLRTGPFEVRREPVATKARVEVRPVEAADVDSAIQEGIEELDADDGDPRRAVIACWLRLERLAAAAGARRSPSDTPAELVAHMLAQSAVSPQVLERLASLYRRARYAPAEVSEDMRADALETLRQLRSELAGVS
jgi:hypothetical protein